jgi:hypothetical protein
LVTCEAQGSAALQRAAPPKQGARPGWPRPCFAYGRPLGEILALEVWVFLPKLNLKTISCYVQSLQKFGNATSRSRIGKALRGLT